VSAVMLYLINTGRSRRSRKIFGKTARKITRMEVARYYPRAYTQFLKSFPDIRFVPVEIIDLTQVRIAIEKERLFPGADQKSAFSISSAGKRRTP
jgi:hypothetical protein